MFNYYYLFTNHSVRFKVLHLNKTTVTYPLTVCQNQNEKTPIPHTPTFDPLFVSIASTKKEKT